MMSPSDEERIVAMVDSFTKTVARNFSRNLKRAKANAEKHYSDEPVDYWQEQEPDDPSISEQLEETRESYQNEVIVQANSMIQQGDIRVGRN